MVKKKRDTFVSGRVVLDINALDAIQRQDAILNLILSV